MELRCESNGTFPGVQHPEATGNEVQIVCECVIFWNGIDFESTMPPESHGNVVFLKVYTADSTAGSNVIFPICALDLRRSF